MFVCAKCMSSRYLSLLVVVFLGGVVLLGEFDNLANTFHRQISLALLSNTIVVLRSISTCKRGHVQSISE